MCNSVHSTHPSKCIMFKQAYILVAIANAVLAATTVTKRGIFVDSGYGFNGFDGFGHNGYSGAPVLFSAPAVDYGKPVSIPKVSPAEIASAIQAAKEASSSVLAAQQRVQEAKQDVLHQQHVASQKQSDAALALQKTEAAAAVQQQEAKAAATALIQAQQRLAHAKAQVAELQRMAATKEAHAAAVIHKSAAAAAHEVQKTDEAARKISYIQSHGTAALRQVANSKQGSLTATSAAVAAASEHGTGGDEAYGTGAWYTQKAVHLQPWG